MHIKLEKNIYLLSDEFQWWIQSETPRKTKKGEDSIYTKRLTGYHGDLERCFCDYFDRSIRSSDLDGNAEDLAKLVKKTRADIRKWMKAIRGGEE